jgi:acetate kinase
MAEAILALNVGSSSIKFSLFAVPRGGADAAALAVLLRGAIEGLATVSAEEETGPRFWVRDAQDRVLRDEPLRRPCGGGARGQKSEHEWALGALLDWIEAHDHGLTLIGAGHRIVHGGTLYEAPILINETVLRQLEALVPLAPLHQPHNLAGIRALRAYLPQLPEVACFDTAFHHTQPPLAQAFALPRDLSAAGIKRYGFHGLSYEYIAQALPAYLGAAAEGRVVVAHLGNGASMCALLGRRSVATTMGFTALDGLPMGTRCGNLDPGVVLYLIAQQGMEAAAVTDLLYRRSGLLGVSGLTSDVRDLLHSDAPQAAEAIDLFVYRIGRELGSLAAALGGLDALVFTAGIGEHAASIRARVCEQAGWLGVRLNDDANQSHGPRISTEDSAVSAWVIPTDEDAMIARHCLRLITSR